MNSNQSGNTNQNQAKISNFLEILKQRQESGVSSSPDSQRFSPLNEIKKQKELEGKRVEQFHQARSREWAQIYSAKQKQVEKRMEEIREQLEKLVKQITKFESNVQKTLQTETPQPGEYHLSFLDHLRAVIELMKKDIKEANSWLSLYQARGKKKGFYWGAAKKQGTSFMLNEERQLATSVG